MKNDSPKPGCAAAEQAPRLRAKFSHEFKQQAVLRLRQREQSAVDIALDLGIRRNQLYKWARKFEQLGPTQTFRMPGRPPAFEEGELVSLRRELSKTQEELAILKKFDAYLTRLAK